MALASDLISKLPSELLCLILSNLPIREAVRSSILSKRWRYLHNQIPKLALSPDLLMGPLIPSPLSISKVENIISNILLLHSADVETFDLYTSNDWHFTCQNVWKWVQYLASKNIRRLSLCHIPSPGQDNLERVTLPPSLFSCKSLATLVLFHHTVSKIPPNFAGFNHLVSCSFLNVEFRDDSLARFISHCPPLETLHLIYCVAPQKIIISAPRMENLLLCFYDPVELLTVDCPKLTHLLISEIKDLRVNGLLFQELSFAVKRLEVQCGSNVIGLSLDWGTDEAHNLSAKRFIEIMETFKFLNHLDIPPLGRQNVLDISTINLLQRLPCLERLEIYDTLNLKLTRDPIPPCLNSPLLNLRMVNAHLHNFDDKEMGVLGWLLENSPALETMELHIPPREAGSDGEDMQFLRRMLDFNFRRSSSQARVHVADY